MATKVGLSKQQFITRKWENLITARLRQREQGPYQWSGYGSGAELVIMNIPPDYCQFPSSKGSSRTNQLFIIRKGKPHPLNILSRQKNRLSAPSCRRIFTFQKSKRVHRAFIGWKLKWNSRGDTRLDPFLWPCIQRQKFGALLDWLTQVYHHLLMSSDISDLNLFGIWLHS